MSMTDQEAIAMAKQELSTSSYLGEITRSPGVCAIHRKRCSWLARLIALAEYGVKYKATVVYADNAGSGDMREAYDVGAANPSVDQVGTYPERPMPMTIEELRSVHGEPVYIDPYGWRICYGVEPADIHGGIEKVNLGNSSFLPLSGYGKLWNPYLQKPNFPIDNEGEGEK